MRFTEDHELHKRRFGRNKALGLVLAGLAAIFFGLTIAKVTRDGPIEGFDHVTRPALAVETEAPEVSE